MYSLHRLDTIVVGLRGKNVELTNSQVSSEIKERNRGKKNGKKRLKGARRMLKGAKIECIPQGAESGQICFLRWKKNIFIEN